MILAVREDGSFQLLDEDQGSEEDPHVFFSREIDEHEHLLVMLVLKDGRESVKKAFGTLLLKVDKAALVEGGIAALGG